MTCPIYTFIFTILLSLFMVKEIAAEPDPVFAGEIDPTLQFSEPEKEAVPDPPATWIWYDYFRNNQTVLFRRSFQLNSPPQQAVIRAAADILLEVWVNGERIVAPNPDREDEWEYMISLDLVRHLKVGHNVIGIAARNHREPAGFLAVLQMDGRRIVSDTEWKVSEHAVEKWETNDFDDSAWPPARPLRKAERDPMGVPVRFPSLSGDTSHLNQALFPAERITTMNGSIESATALLQCDGMNAVFRPPAAESTPPFAILDFGREMTGGVILHVQGRHSGRFHIQVGESYSEVTHKAMNSHSQYEWKQDLFPGTEVRLGRTAYRFVRIEWLESEGPVEIDAVQSACVYYPIQRRGSFTCSDPVLNRIWTSGAYTLHACMQEDIWDGPKRDQMPWMGDLYVENAVNHYTFYDDFLFLRTMDRLRESFPAQSHINKIPSYTLMWPSALYEHYLYHGDLEILRERHDAVVNLLKWMELAFDENGLYADTNPGWCFVDWGNLTLPEAQQCTHMFAIKAFRDGAEICKAVGDSEHERRFRNYTDRLSQAANKYWLDRNHNTFGPSKHINARAVWSGLAEGRRAQAITEKVLLPEKEDHWATPYGNYFYIQALSQSGHTDKALAFIRNYWGSMLEQGATTLWEAWDPRWALSPSGIAGPVPDGAGDVHVRLTTFEYRGYMISLCHGWSAGPTAWMAEHILGVKPLKPGYQVTAFYPRLFDLEQAKGIIPTPQGDIEVDLERDSGVNRYSINPPASGKLQVRLEATTGAKIETFSGKKKMNIQWNRSEGYAETTLPSRKNLRFVVYENP